MSVPAANVRPHAYSSGTAAAGAGIIDLSFSDNAILVITTIVVQLGSALINDNAYVALNDGILCFAKIENPPQSTQTPTFAIDKTYGDIVVENIDLLKFHPGTSGPSTWAIHGYYWVPDTSFGD